MSTFNALRAAILFWPNTWSFVLTLIAAAIIIYLIVRYVRNKDTATVSDDAYPQTTSVRTNIQSAKPAEPKSTVIENDDSKTAK